MRKAILIGIFVITEFFLSAINAENLVYTLRDVSSEALNKIATHLSQIQIISPQSFIVRPNGDLKGYLNASLVDFAHQHGLKLLPFITNPEDNEKAVHQFLRNDKAQSKAIRSLVDIAVKNRLYGYQVDFEKIAVADKNLFTRFYQRLSSALHQNHLALSIAIIPRLNDRPGDSAFLQARYKHYTGVYDYSALGKASDFVSLMAYDEHVDETIPGPTAGYHWVQNTVQYALKYLPANKISLGVPTYSTYWKTERHGNEGIFAAGEQVSYDTAESILHNHHAHLVWNVDERCYYTFYTANELNEFVFLEDQTSFKAKMNLATRSHLRGVSVYRLGVEDPKVWQF